ncbi:mitochondrial DNA polymerase I protein A [Novymonas esmeraldas]|uniref:DNA-directed DNA polymerase n=1 Tax=Novymonas esmeraldas TaxID=1808958 RepID=A0AAW0F6N2_9TRYP
MDPFRRDVDGAANRRFRTVPMTHLASATVCASAWGTPAEKASVGSATAAPPPPSSSSHRHGLLESDETSRNVRKWCQFGLDLGVAAPPTLPPPPQHQQQQQVCAPSDMPLHRQGTRHQRVPQSTESDGGIQLLPPRRHSSEAAAGLLSHSARRTTSAPAWPHHSATAGTHESAHTARRTGSRGGAVVVSDEEELSVDADDRRCCTAPMRGHDATPPRRTTGVPTSSPATAAAPPPSPPPPPLAHDAPQRGDDSASTAIQLQAELAKLSEKVQHSTEERRCGPPRRSGAAASSAWASKGRVGRKGKKAATAAANDEGGGDDATGEVEAGGTGDEAGAVRDDGGASTGRGRGKAATRKRGRTGAGAASEGTDEVKARKRGGGGGGGAASLPRAVDSVARAMRAPRTLFSLASAGTGGGAMAALQSGPTAAAAVSIPYVHLSESAESLFADVRRALDDPDRIQAPPLFVGIAALGASTPTVAAHAGVECRTNFSYYGSGGAKSAKRRVSCCFSSLDPVRSHQHVELVVVRWKEELYALPAQSVGLAFLCRVLTELPGVELITFNAQVLLVTLLAYGGGTLWSHCISDVRVMAWMAQLHVATAPSKAAAPSLSSSAAAAPADGVPDTDASQLYDYEQLLLHVCGGKVPPTVQLERTGTADSNATAAGAAPPLTPAHRQLAQQVYYLATVYRSLYGHLGSKGLLQAFLRQEKRIALLLALLKYNGMGVDLREVHRYQRACEAEMARQRSLAKKLVPELGDEFNIQSHDQCRKALYEVLQLGKHLLQPSSGGDGVGAAAVAAGLTITKGGRLSTAEETLRILARHHSFPACLLRYRKASKLVQTYVEGMMGYAVVRADASPLVQGEAAVAADDDSPFLDRRLLHTGSNSNSNSNSNSRADPPPRARSSDTADGEASVTLAGEVTLPGSGYATLHANFLQEGTDTGRLSCVEPNLQNLPRNGMLAAVVDGGAEEDGEEDLLGFRRCFVAAAGCVLLSVDYEQIELRVLAHLCGDPALVQALTTSTDIHRAIAEVVFKKKPVSSEERTLAKRVVFGVLYGAGPRTLAAHMGVTVDRALQVTSLLTNAFPGIDTYHRRVIEESRASGFVRTLSGRLRYLPDLRSAVLARRSYAERQAFNSVVQGSAADVMKTAMLAVSTEVLQRYDRADVCLLSQIHDEMVFMVRKELLPRVVPLVSAAMSHAMQLLVPLSVTVKFGHSLGDLQEWSVEHDLGLGVDL